MRLRLGVVGLGSAWQTRYAPTLRALNERFEVRAIYEPVAHRAQQAAQQFGARSEDGFRALTSREDVDAILLLSCQWHGWLPVLAACEAGKAVYCAENFDLPPDEAQRIKGRIEQAGIAFMAELPRRHAPATQRLLDLMATRLGPPKLLFCHRRRASAGAKGADPPSNMRELIEAIDWCRYLVGREATAVTGVTHHGSEKDAPDYQMMSVDFSDPDRPGSGAVAQISSGRYILAQWPEAVYFRPPADLQVACQNGVAFIDLPFTLTWFDSAGRHLELLESERPVDELLLTQFHRSVTSLVRDMSNLDDAFRAYWIALTAQTSFNEGRRMRISF
jgi:predicted dehydrogenase